MKIIKKLNAGWSRDREPALNLWDGPTQPAFCGSSAGGPAGRADPLSHTCIKMFINIDEYGLILRRSALLQVRRAFIHRIKFQFISVMPMEKNWKRNVFSRFFFSFSVMGLWICHWLVVLFTSQKNQTEIWEMAAARGLLLSRPVTFVTGNAKKLEEVRAILGNSIPFQSLKLDCNLTLPLLFFPSTCLCCLFCSDI